MSGDAAINDNADATERATHAATEAARLALREEIGDAVSAILDRDSFLTRIARRVAELTGQSNVAIYARSIAGDSDLLRASTFATSDRLPLRLGLDASASRDELNGTRLAGQPIWAAITAPIGVGNACAGTLVIRSDLNTPLTAVQVRTITELALEMAPAVAVAEEHHAVKQSSVIDLATGACNYWYLSQRFEEEIARAQRTKNPITIVLARILDFERVQYSIGYERSDKLLRDLASEYAGLTRTFDIVGMRSRADFSILLPDTDMASAATVIARVHRRSGRVIEKLQATHPGLTVQVVTGAAAFPSDGERVPEVVLAAEQRLDQNETLHRRTAESA